MLSLRREHFFYRIGSHVLLAYLCKKIKNTMHKNLAKGVLFVALGASSFGMLATIVKLAYKEGYTTAEVTSSQFAFGILFLILLNLIPSKEKIQHQKASKKDITKLILSGTSMGFTSVLYYLCVRYINASIAVVLLMQSVWIGVVFEVIQTKKAPSIQKIISVILILTGTLIATNTFNSSFELDIRGLIFGFLAAISFSMTLLTTNSVATHLKAIRRSLFMLFGGAIVVILFSFITQVGPNNFNFMKEMVSDTTVIRDFNFNIFITWGIILSLFGTVIPPILLNKGFPLTGVGLGSIISSLELPVSVTFAFFLLNEQVSWIQWSGILIILSAIVLMNYNLLSRKSNL